jgi:hypothetical protein
MSVKGHLALLVGVFVVALQQARRDLQRWRAALAEADRLLVDRVLAGPPAGSRPHTGRPRCGKIPVTGSGPTRHRETGILADQQVIGKVGRVTGTIGPERVGEVMIPIRGGSEAFNAYAADAKDTISTGTRVVVIEYFPPRTVVVSPM